MKTPFKRNLKMYRNYVCPYCFYQINKCICKVYPPYALIQIDEGIQEIVRELNRKGYKTKYSCEGHFDYSYNIYIKFYEKYNFPKLPKGFTKSDFVIEHIMTETDNEDKFNQEKKEYLSLLKEWVKSLN